jgi:Domain of unknown function (DUF4267)
MNQIQVFVSTHHNLLLAILRTFSIITSCTTFYGGFCALFLPSALADTFGIPFDVPRTKKPSSKGVSDEDKTLAALFILFAVREFSLATILGILVYLNEIKALSYALLAVALTGAGDAFAAWNYGVKGAWKLHFYATLLVVVLVVPLGLLLDSSS